MRMSSAEMRMTSSKGVVAVQKADVTKNWLVVRPNVRVKPPAEAGSVSLG